MKYLKIITSTIFLSMIMLITYAQTDKKVDLTKALIIGDIFVPPKNVKILRGPLESIDWQYIQNKVLILDFFDTGCTTCIKSMPKLQQLQNKLKDKVQIINVGWQDRATLEKLYETNEYIKENNVNLPVIYDDVYLKERFPHQGVPHVVFLFKGKVKAITMWDFITEENIVQLYETGSINIPLKDDYRKGSLVEENINLSAQVKEGVWISGYQNGIPSESLIIKKDSVSGLIKTSFYNVSVYSAILFNWAKVKRGNYIPRPERLIMKVKDPDRYQDIQGVGESWFLKNAISYERIDKIQRTDSAQAWLVLNDLHSFFGIRSYRTMQEMDCLILKKCPVKPYKGVINDQKMTYANSSVLATMTDLSEKFPPVLDMVKSKEKIALTSYNTLEDLNAQLAAYGIEAVLGRGKLEVLVIEEVE